MSNLNNSDIDTNKNLVDYFEVGCLCLMLGKIEKPKSGYLEDKLAYYMDNCTCSRHPESSKRDCWDRKVKLSNIEIVRLNNFKGLIP